MVRAVVCYIFIDYSTMVLGIRLLCSNVVRTRNRVRNMDMEIGIGDAANRAAVKA